MQVYKHESYDLMDVTAEEMRSIYRALHDRNELLRQSGGNEIEIRRNCGIRVHIQSVVPTSQL